MKITRKEFLRKAWGLIFLPYLVFLVLMARRHAWVSRPEKLRITGPVPEGISFHGEVICVKQGDILTAYSSRCSHLGCRINKSESGRLICPCHGSEFDTHGEVVKGPALDSLEVLPWAIDSKTSDILINLKN